MLCHHHLEILNNFVTRACIFILYQAPQLWSQSCFLSSIGFLLLFTGPGTPCEVKEVTLALWGVFYQGREHIGNSLTSRNFPSPRSPPLRESLLSVLGHLVTMTPTHSSPQSETSVFLFLGLLTWTLSHPLLPSGDSSSSGDWGWCNSVPQWQRHWTWYLDTSGPEVWAQVFRKRFSW